MGRGTGGEALAVLLQARRVEVVEPEVFEDAAVGGLLGLVGQHPAHLVAAAEVVALVVPPVGAVERVLADVDRALPAVWPEGLGRRGRACRPPCTIGTSLVGEEVDADLAPVVERGPRTSFSHLGGVVQPVAPRVAVVLDAQDDDTAVGVRHRRCRSPTCCRGTPPLADLNSQSLSSPAVHRLQDVAGVQSYPSSSKRVDAVGPWPSFMGRPGRFAAWYSASVFRH